MRFRPSLPVILLAVLGAVVTVGPVNAQKVPPKPVYRPEPNFNDNEQTKGLTGAVVAEFVISERGDVRDIRITECTHPEFEAPAVDCIATWKFTPATIDGEPVMVRVRQRLDVLAPRSFDGFQLALSDEWTVSITEADEATGTPSIVRVRKGEIRFEIKTVPAGEGEKLEEYAQRILEEENGEEESVETFRIYRDQFQREVAGENREGARVRVSYDDLSGRSLMVFEVYRFSAGERDYQVLVSYSVASPPNDIRTLGVILNRLKSEP